MAHALPMWVSMNANAVRIGRTEDVLDHAVAPLEPVRIEVIAGPSQGLAIPLSGGTVSVGSAGCDVNLTDASVSRRHASIELLPGAVRVRDLGSRNGTRYLNAKISEAVIPLGGTIALGRSALRITPASGPQLPLSARTELFGLYGVSAAMRTVFTALERFAHNDTVLLIEGERGTGKELAARALHAASSRAQGPFVVFDCASFDAHSIDQALFGDPAVPGLGSPPCAIDSAIEGTLYLDAVELLPSDVQAKLLRFIDVRERPQTGRAPKQVSLRIVVGTHRRLANEVLEGRFRQDLYYRLSSARVYISPLRERPEDIAALAAQFARETTGGAVALPRALVAAMECEQWPGNGRELKAAVQRALANPGWSPDIMPTSTKTNVADVPAFHDARDRLLSQFEREYLTALLKRKNGNVSAAARAAKLVRSQFYRLLTKHQLVGMRPE